MIVTQYLKENKWAIVCGLFVYILFLSYTLTGTRICDCEPTEKYNSASFIRTGTSATVNRFYHK